MNMNMTYLKRSARKMGALVALAGSIPMAVEAAPEPDAAKASRAPVAQATVPSPSPSSYFVPAGESRVFRLDRPMKRVAVGNPEVADYIRLSSSELYLLGKKPGATNITVWDQNGNATSTPLQVGRNSTAIRSLLKAVLPNETDIHV